MKKIIIGLIGIFLVFFSSIIVNASVNSDWADSNNMAKYKQVDTEFRAVWVATVSNIDISKQKNKKITFTVSYYFFVCKNDGRNDYSGFHFQSHSHGIPSRSFHLPGRRRLLFSHFIIHMVSRTSHLS